MAENEEMIMEQHSDTESDESMDEIDETHEHTEDTETNDLRSDVYLPSQALQDGEELVCDQSAYIMLHQAQSGAPCLSFDIVQDSLGNNREAFPLSMYIVAGTQAAKTLANNVIIMKMSNLHRTGRDDGDDDDSDCEELTDDEDENKPVMCSAMIKHLGCVNRIRSTVINNTQLVASWSELGRVNIFDVTQQFQLLERPADLAIYNKNNSGNSATPLYTFSGHQQEGFGIDWSRMSPGVLASGDCRRDIHVWVPTEGGSWQVDQRPLVGHTDSVEDLQWSPNERSVLASCSVDRSIRIWDTRAAPGKACMLTADNAHTSDVNVINWNRNEPFLASGGDDGFLKVWDLRQFQTKEPVAIFKQHTAPVTTVEWHPTESTIFASGGADNQIALWDLSVEKDSDTNEEEIKDIPPQLLFIHQGQTDIKELHWHPQVPGVILSTAHSGFNIFRTISV